MVRVKFRYVLLEIVCEDFLKEDLVKLPFTSSDVYSAIHNSVVEMYGDYGAGMLMSGFAVKLLNPYTRIAYVRSKQGPHVYLNSALPFVTEIKKTRCSLRNLHLSGTIRSCHKFLQSYHHQRLASMLLKCSTDEERKEVQNSIRTCLKAFTPKVYPKTQKA